jgi:hypothetical protein
MTPDLSREHYEQGGELRHLFAVSGFLDDSWFHRTHWIYGSHIKSGNVGWYMAPRYAPSGRLLAVDGATVYGFGRTQHGFMWRDAQAYHLWSANADVRPGRVEQVRAVVDGKSTAYAISRHRQMMDARSVQEVSAVDFNWSIREPALYARSVIKAGEVIVAAGVPKVLDENALHESPDDEKLLAAAVEQQTALDGGRGGVMLVVNAATGEVVEQRKVASGPVWDGVAAAGGRLYMATMDGKLVCW